MHTQPGPCLETLDPWSPNLNQLLPLLNNGPNLRKHRHGVQATWRVSKYKTTHATSCCKERFLRLIQLPLTLEHKPVHPEPHTYLWPRLRLHQPHPGPSAKILGHNPRWYSILGTSPCLRKSWAHGPSLHPTPGQHKEILSHLGEKSVANKVRSLSECLDRREMVCVMNE